jgi:60 kDa SS-A/Ro ribonucleoprotein
MTANDVSIADPTDPGMLDVAGFDSAVPNMIADFSRGDI